MANCRRFLGFVLMWALITGCGGGLEFSVRFAAIDGLRAGDAVRTESVAIGEVAAVDYSDRGDYQVAVRIEPPHVDQVRHGSLFFIDGDSHRPGRKALIVIPDPAGGVQIDDGETVAGTPKWTALMQRMTMKVESEVAELATELDRHWRALAGMPTSEQVARLEQELDRILAELDHLGASARKTLENDILPRLREQLEALRDALESPEHDAQLDRLEDKVERIDRELTV
jgi:hypothetical protein